MKVLITGASGFVGRALMNKLLSEHLDVVGTARNNTQKIGEISLLNVGNIGEGTDWRSALVGCDAVVHVAGRAHMLHDKAENKLYEFRKVNYHGTVKLAEQAASMGIKRFIFISTIGVNGVETKTSYFDESCEPAPHSPYAISKYEAEIGLRDIEKNTGMEVVIIRPPLVCGINAPGNLERLFKLVSKLSVFPFGAVSNKRSMISLDNLVDFIFLCITHPEAKGETFTISDDEALSTKKMIIIISKAMNKRCYMLYFPPVIFRFFAMLFNRQGIYQQLFGNLLVSNAKAKELLGWEPIVSTPHALSEAVRESLLK